MNMSNPQTMANIFQNIQLKIQTPTLTISDNRVFTFFIFKILC